MKRVHSVAAAVVLNLAVASVVQAAPLDTVREKLSPLRDHSLQTAAPAAPGYFTARDELRSWIDAHITAAAQGVDTEALQKDLNAEIANADLACADAKPPGYDRCASPSQVDARGYVGLIEVARLNDYLIVESALGVSCGFDETSVLYQWTRGRWRQVISTAQDKGAKPPYIPEQVEQFFYGQVSGKTSDGRLVAATAVQPTCGENMRPVHYRLWHVAANGAVTPMVDGRESKAYTGRRSPAVSARFEGYDFLVEMDVASLDPRTHSRIAVRRFRTNGKGVNRVAPIALTPRVFVEEWLLSPWDIASTWSKIDVRPALQKAHASVAAAHTGNFTGTTKRCAKTNDIMQVMLRMPTGEMFFRLRADPNGAYEMLSAGPTSDSTCTLEDAVLDTPRSLF